MTAQVSQPKNPSYNEKKKMTSILKNQEKTKIVKGRAKDQKENI